MALHNSDQKSWMHFTCVTVLLYKAQDGEISNIASSKLTISHSSESCGIHTRARRCSPVKSHLPTIFCRSTRSEKPLPLPLFFPRKSQRSHSTHSSHNSDSPLHSSPPSTAHHTPPSRPDTPRAQRFHLHSGHPRRCQRALRPRRARSLLVC